jgi:iron complex outermembrane recepter protein
MSSIHRHALLLLGSARLVLAAEPAAPAAPHEALEEIIVTASPLRSHPLDTAQPVSVLAGDDLRRSVAASLGETLSQQPGVSSSYYGPVASRPIIRGLTGYRVQMLEDGLASMDASNVSDDHAVTLEPALAKQIEVLRGPAALLYGSGGAGGVVNVVSGRLPDRAPAPALQGALELRGDSALDERTGVAELGAMDGPLAWHFDGYRRETGPVRIPGAAVSARLRAQLAAQGIDAGDARGTVANSGSDSWGAGAGATWFGEDGSLGLALGHFDTEYGLPTEETAFIRMKQDRVDLKGQLRFDGGFFTALNVRAGLGDYTHTEFEAPGVPGTLFDNRQYEVRGTLDRIIAGGARSTFGVQYSHQDFEAIGDEAFVPPAITRTAGLFVVDERDVGAWTLQAGGRLDNQKIDPTASSGRRAYDANALSLSAGAVWRFAEEQALALNLTRTQRHPQSTELYADGTHGALQRIEIGAEDLHKETGQTIDLALRRTGPRLNWNLGVFFNRYSDYIFIAPTGATDPAEDLPIYAYRQEDADLYGLEGEIGAPLGFVTQGTLRARLFGDALRGRVRHGGGPLPAIPPLRAGLGLDYDLDALHVGMQLVHNAAQTRTAAAELPTDSFLMLDIDLSYRVDLGRSQLLLFLRGSNLLDEEARVHASPLKDMIPLPGRSARLGVRLEFGS